MSKLTHISPNGEAQMVDVSEKPVTQRQAVAEGTITMQPDTFTRILEGEHKKGDVLGVARLAAIMATKKTADLIPLCHPIPIAAIDIDFTPDSSRHAILCRAAVTAHAQTGVEMEALTAVHIALLTIYDMCKAVDRGMTMDNIRLVSKSGGRSGSWTRA